LPGEDDAAVPKDELARNLIGELHYMLGFTLAQRDWRRGQAEFALAAGAAPDNDVLFYNLGLVYHRNGLEDDALAAFKRSDEINPRALANRQRIRASDKIVEIEAERERLATLELEIAAGDPIVKSIPAGSPEYHRRLAELLSDRGEAAAARGHRLRVLELRGGAP
jgi:tetratricopeptide (TPR) repeat protein